ncbi:ribonuclease H-like domain-containing protein [Thiobaca trueperi]|uniref:Putative 3'-5' exonuclease similar to PolB exonuclease domain n=1 Tax=Thiobaca trueperi TaxID=127458 RepID=A0A4V6NZY4_9GAMM|nr:ribonuclease H-like domain-containing protein [Thiobaca trueperi]TCT21182.1 putative 3'-5' exonuclease similar to PolB exonuclease domain [Thiobaca trueperi]
MIATPHTAHVVTLTQTMPVARFVVLDLETGDAPEDAIQAAIRQWKAPSNWKPETVEKNRAEQAEKIREKAALLDASPILCAGLRSDREAVMFNGMGDTGPLDLPGWTIESHPDECAMLAALGQWLNAHTDDVTALVGHNVRGFDLPKLRGGFVRHRLPLPACLKPRDGQGQPVTDTMSLFKSFSMEHRDDFAVSLDVVATAFGIPRPKQYVSGADVPRLHREGQIAAILTYNAIDIDATAEIYRRMMA